MRFIPNTIHADVILVYLAGTGAVLLVDFRIPDSPFTMVVPDERFFLHGSVLNPPLTPKMVQSIEDQSILPRMPYVAHSYIQQWLLSVGRTLEKIRPGIPLPETIAAYRHLKPSFLIVSTPLWGKLEEAMMRCNNPELRKLLTQVLGDLFIEEISYPERFSDRRREIVAADLKCQRVFRKYC